MHPDRDNKGPLALSLEQEVVGNFSQGDLPRFISNFAKVINQSVNKTETAQSLFRQVEELFEQKIFHNWDRTPGIDSVAAEYLEQVATISAVLPKEKVLDFNLLMIGAHISKGTFRYALSHLELARADKTQQSAGREVQVEIDSAAVVQRHAVFSYMQSRAAQGDPEARTFLSATYEAFCQSFEQTPELALDVVELISMLNSLVMYEIDNQLLDKAKQHIREYKDLNASLPGDIGSSNLIYILNAELAIFLNDGLTQTEAIKWAEDLADSGFRYLSCWNAKSTPEETENMKVMFPRFAIEAARKFMFDCPEYDDIFAVSKAFANCFESIAEAASVDKYPGLRTLSTSVSLYFSAIEGDFNRAHIGVRLLDAELKTAIRNSDPDVLSQLTAITYIYEMLLSQFGDVLDEHGAEFESSHKSDLDLAGLLENQDLSCLVEIAGRSLSQESGWTSLSVATHISLAITESLGEYFTLADETFSREIALLPAEQKIPFAFDYAQLLIARREMARRIDEITSDPKVAAHIEDLEDHIYTLNSEFGLNLPDLAEDPEGEDRKWGE